jgi:mRNA interferase RelE/StbE
MKYSIFYKRSASDELLKLPANIAHKIKAAINSLSENTRPRGCKKLKGSVNAYRIRIGNYRVIYTINDTVLIITVIKIAHRKDVYR